MRGQAGFFDVEERRDPATHALEPVYSVHYNDYAGAANEIRSIRLRLLFAARRFRHPVSAS
jgi:hypothetical protein